MITDADRVWADSMPAAYEQWLVPAVFRPFAVDLAQRLPRPEATRVLELAAGTGVLTREVLAAAPTADVVATDFNAAMVDLGQRTVPAAQWQQADAMHLPFDAAAFDIVCCQFGVMFFPDKAAAFAEARRVLDPGGVLLFNTWAELAAHEFQAALVEALAAVFPVDPPTFMVQVPHGCADADRVVTDVRAGGFGHVTVAEVTLEGRAASAADVAAGYCGGTPLRTAIESRGADLAATTAAVAVEMEKALGSGEVTGRMTAYVFEALP